MKKRKILYLFPLVGLLLSSCDAEEILAQIGNGFNNGKDWVVNTVTGKTGEKEEEHEEEKPQEHQGEEEKPPVVVKDFEGITLEDLTVPYDGKAHTLEVQGALPAEAKVTYGEHGNSFTNVGRYEVTAVVSAEGYNDLNLQATLTITKGKLEGITLEDLTIVYDGQPHSIEVQGDLPEGATVSYGAAGNEFKYPGAHKVKATISCPGYEDLVLTATLTIVDAIFEGVVFEDAAFTYDGKVHRIEVGGELPAGATVSYPNGNGAVDPGEYEIEAIVRLHGYQDLELTATLTILEAQFEGIVFEDKEVYFNGAEHEIAPVVPEMYKGATITYGEAGNKFTDVGSYEVEATVSLHGYVSWTGKATLTIATGTISGVSLEDATVEFDGEAHTIALTGELPAGVTFEYKEGYESAVNPGSYEIKGVAKGEGYFDLDLSATLTIEAKDATEPLMVTDFEGLTDNDLADDYELKYFKDGTGWIDPSSAKMTIEKGNQVFGSGSQTMKMSITHQGAGFKVTKDLDRSYKKYTGFAIDTMMDPRGEGGSIKAQVQFWFKDLPLPEDYAGYRNTYVTYTLASEAPTTWTHWEIPFTDETMSISGGKIPAAALSQLGFTIADLSIYIDQVAFIVTPSYVNGGPSCFAYVDNIELTRGTEKVVDQYIYGGRYATVVEDNYLAVDINEAFSEATFSQNGEAIAFASVEKEGQKVIFKDKDYAGAGLTIEAAIDGDRSLKVESVTGQAAANFAGLNGLVFVKHAKLNYDLQDKKSQVGNPLNDTNWKQEKWDSTWQTISNQMNVRNNGDNIFCNMVTGYYLDHRYTYTNPFELGLANKFSMDFGNDFNGAATIRIKVRLLTAQNKEIYVAGDASNYQEIPGGTPKWQHFETRFDEAFIRSVIVTVKSTRSGNDYFYFDNLKVEYEMPEPVVPVNELVDGSYYLWNGSNDAYRLDISDNLSKASVTKCGSETSIALNVAIEGNDLTLKDAQSEGLGFLATATIDEEHMFTIKSVEGSVGSAFVNSLKDKQFKPCADVNVDFSDGTVGSKYSNSHWTSQQYTDKWSDMTPDMNSRADASGNKVVNLVSGGYTRNFIYTPDLPMGPVNHISFDMANYYGSSAGDIQVKVCVIDAAGYKSYALGDASNFVTIVKDTSKGSVLDNYDLDINLIVGRKLQITTKCSAGTSYLYVDNFKVDYKGPEPVTPPQPQSNYTLEDGSYYVWNGSSDAFRIEIANSQTTATVQKVGGSANSMTVSVSGDTVTFKDAAYSGAGLTIVADLTADNAMTIKEVSGQAASIYSGSLLNKNVKHCADVSIDFSDGTVGQKYSNSHWTSQQYTDKWSDMTPDMNSRADASGNKVVNLVSGGYTRNFIYTPDLPMGPVNHIEFDMANYYGSSAGDIQVKVCVIDAGGNKSYALGDASNFVTIVKDTSKGSVLVHYDLGINLCVGQKLQITTKCSAGTSYLYVDNFQIYYAA